MKERILGIIGAFIGGLVASLPWVLMYVYGEMIWSLLAIIIAIGALKGYQLFKGPNDKGLPWIIGIVTLISVVISTLIFIPCLSLAKEELDVSIYNLKVLYQYEPFVTAITKDLIMSIFFAILGAGGILANIKRQIETGEKVTGLANKYDEYTSYFEPIFVKYNALNKNTTLTKEQVLNELDLVDKEVHFDRLVRERIIRKTSSGYYLKK